MRKPYYSSFLGLDNKEAFIFYNILIFKMSTYKQYKHINVYFAYNMLHIHDICIQINLAQVKIYNISNNKKFHLFIQTRESEPNNSGKLLTNKIILYSIN